MMLDGLYVDTRAKKAVALQVKPAFKPLFRVWLDVPKADKSLVRIGMPNIVHGDPEGDQGLQELNEFRSRLIETRSVAWIRSGMAT